MEFINGGVTAAKGFIASGLHCGIRKNQVKKDLAMIKSEVRCPAAAVYTQNKVKGAPILVTKNNLEKTGGIVQGMSGSPIIQDNKIIGAVTHVVVNDPHKGYGILITNMLEEAEN